MKSKLKQDRAWLLTTAKAVARELKRRGEGTRLRIRVPIRATSTNTDGWSAVIGHLGKGGPRLEVWLDRFTGYAERKLWACFTSYHSRPPIMAITKRVSDALWPIRTMTLADAQTGKYFIMTKRLARTEFNMPVLEKYNAGETFYGIYDPTRETAERVSPHFCARAVAFFEDVARALPHAAVEDEHHDVYARFENRKRVASHLHRERSKLLAAECKIRDRYRCQVCGFDFAKGYGKLGNEFAEAHHLVPLARLRENVRTHLEELITVCANCHRMLHRMDGRRHDIRKLKSIVRRHQP